MSRAPDLPIVVLGGGIVGCSVAHHLTERGWRDVVLLEQAEIAGGTTWHAAGMVGRLRTSTALTRINDESARLYASLHERTGIDVGWTECGSLIVGASEARMSQLRRTSAMAEVFGVEAHLVDTDEIRRRWPLMRHDDLHGGVWLPHDGKVIPQETARALAAAARRGGARILEHSRVLELLHADGRMTGVRYEQHGERHELPAAAVVLCGGMWSRQLAATIGVDVPLWPVEHHYVVSAPIDGAHHGLPNARDPDSCIYFRTDGDRIWVGAFQKESIYWDVPRVPDAFSFQLLEADWPKFAGPVADARHRLPALQEVEFEKFVNGPESFTPDNQFILGESPQKAGLWLATGFNSVGIASAGGAGRALADWMVDGDPGMDLWSVDVRRFMGFHNDEAYLKGRVIEVLGLHYQMAWPNRELQTSRGVRRSALHERLRQRGAHFGTKMGWERPNWFAPGEVDPPIEYSFGRQNWFEQHAAEHRAAREAVAVFDQSSFSKFQVTGRDALGVLQRLCGADLDVEPGRVVYTGLFNERGTFESDLSVMREDEDRFLLISATAQTVRDADWIRRNTPPDAELHLVDRTDDFGVIGVMGPRSRELLQPLCAHSLADADFPFGTSAVVEIGGVALRAVRITYVGELGWELHVPREGMVAVDEALQAAGAAHGLRDAGHYAVNSLRLEKAYRAWGHELGPDDSPLEAGLGFALAWDKPGGFLGREALLRQREQGPPRRRLCTFVLEDPEPVLWGQEPILRDGRIVGHTTSGANGPSVGGAVAMGYVRRSEGPASAAWLREGRYEILNDGRRHAARLHLRAPWDPDRERILR